MCKLKKLQGIKHKKKGVYGIILNYEENINVFFMK